MTATATPATSDTKRGFVLSFPISKVDAERGEVWGFATTEAVDQQGEIVDYDASKRAFSDWTTMINTASKGKSLGNVREMHQPKSIGKLIAWKADDERKGIWVGAKVDRATADGKDAWRKVTEGELNGFSIGAPYAERQIETKVGYSKPVMRVVDYKLSELSLVDNPACPEAFFSEVKLAKACAGNTVEISRALAEFPENEEPEPRGEDRDVKKTSEKDGLIANDFVYENGTIWRYEGGILKESSAQAQRMEPMARPKEAAERPPTTVQTLIFDKSKFDAEKAKSWARSHEFSAGKVDETAESFRLRQRDPGDFAGGSFRTIELTRGVSAVIGHLKDGKSAGSETSALEKVVSEKVFEILYAEEAMPDQSALEKAGKKIGPMTRPVKNPPGPATPSLESPPERPKPAKSAEAEADANAEAEAEADAGAKDGSASVEGLNTGRPGGPHDSASDQMSVPSAQGKDAEAMRKPEDVGYGEKDAKKEADHDDREGHECPNPAAHEMGKDGDAEARYGYCAMCGKKFAEAARMPYHKECAARRKSAGADSAGLAKVLMGQAESMKLVASALQKLAVENEDLKKRLEKIEAEPMPGGPHRTELPPGVAVMEKGGGIAGAVDEEQLLMKAAELVRDPIQRQTLQMEASRLGIKKAQSRNI